MFGRKMQVLSVRTLNALASWDTGQDEKSIRKPISIPSGLCVLVFGATNRWIGNVPPTGEHLPGQSTEALGSVVRQD